MNAPGGLSPAGLTAQVGFIRLAHEDRNSGKPEFGGPSLLRDNPIASSPDSFAKKMDARVKPAHDNLMKSAEVWQLCVFALHRGGNNALND
jgi:hypothetical protein